MVRWSGMYLFKLFASLALKAPCAEKNVSQGRVIELNLEKQRDHSQQLAHLLSVEDRSGE